jgi:type III secretory pathway component EscV
MIVVSSLAISLGFITGATIKWSVILAWILLVIEYLISRKKIVELEGQVQGIKELESELNSMRETKNMFKDLFEKESHAHNQLIISLHSKKTA